MAKRDEADYDGATYFIQPIEKRAHRSNLPFVSSTLLSCFMYESMNALDIVIGLDYWLGGRRPS